MASLLCAPSSLATITIPNSRLQLQQKPNSLVSFTSVLSQAKDESRKSVFPLFPLTHRSSRTSTTATKAVASTDNVTPAAKAVPDVPTYVDATVEHVALLQMQEPQDGTNENFRQTLKTAFNSLKCLPGVLYLSSGFVGETYSAPGPFNFFLHSRHTNQLHRDRFMQHPLKFGFSMGFTEGITDDFMMLDFIHKHNEPLDHPQYGYANRYVFLKLKDGVDESSLAHVIESFFPGSLAKPTFGSIIEPCFTVPGTEADAVKGYNLGMHAAFPNKAALVALGAPEVFGKALADKLAGVLVDNKSVFVVDYEVDQVYNGTW